MLSKSFLFVCFEKRALFFHFLILWPERRVGFSVFWEMVVVASGDQVSLYVLFVFLFSSLGSP